VLRQGGRFRTLVVGAACERSRVARRDYWRSAGSFAAFGVWVAMATTASAANPQLLLPAGDVAAPSADAVSLGRTIFLDESLSTDGRISCATCHQPKRAFSDGKAVASGAGGRAGTRNTPTLLDVAARINLTWDGRETHLEAQVLRPFTQASEHGLRGSDELLSRIRGNASYARRFPATFDGRAANLADLAAALSAYLRTLSSEPAAFDRFSAGDVGALSDSARRGYDLFRGRAGCAECHRIDGARATFTDDAFHRVGVGLPAIAARLPELVRRVNASSPAEIDRMVLEDRDIAELGRYLVTRDPRDIGAYRTPSLRNVAVTPPYMHDGSVATLAEAVSVEVYYRAQARDRAMAIGMNDQADLVEFLGALTGAGRATDSGPKTVDTEAELGGR